MLEIEQKTGFMPVGWKFHLDEGTMEENGNYRLNHHAQLIFMNHDKATGKPRCVSFKNAKEIPYGQSCKLWPVKDLKIWVLFVVFLPRIHTKTPRKRQVHRQKQESNVSAAEHVAKGIAIVLRRPRSSTGPIESPLQGSPL